MMQIVRRKVGPNRAVRKRCSVFSLLVPALLGCDLQCSLLLALFVAALLGVAPTALAIPANTPIVNTANASYSVGSTDFSIDASTTVVTDAGSGNSAPSGISLNPGSVDENSSSTLIGTLLAVDSDPADTHTYALAPGADPRFVVVGSDLILVAGTSFNFEAETEVTLPIEVTDNNGATSTINYVLTINNVNETPTDIEFTSTTVPHSTAGASIASMTSIDPDTPDSHTYSVDDPRFTAVGNELRLAPGVIFADGESAVVQVTTTDAGGLTHTESLTVTTVPPTGDTGDTVSVEFLQHAPTLPTAEPVDVGQALCVTPSGARSVDQPNSPFGAAIPIPGATGLAPADLYVAGESAFLRVVDAAANLDLLAVDRVQIEITTPSGDLETLEILETGVNSGSFLGYLPLRRNPISLNSCELDVGVNEQLEVRYVNAANAANVASAEALVDPLGVLFDSASGRLIDGATVQLLNADTGEPAAVFGDDGVQPYPSTLISGGSTVDAGGNLYDFASGAYRFPFVAPGNYRLVITPPNRFTFPSAVVDATLQILPGGPYALGPGSRGNPFAVPVGPAVRVDVPLDLQPVTPSPSEVEWLLLAPGDPSSSAEILNPTACFDGQNFTASPAAVSLNQGALSTPLGVEVRAASRFRRGEVMLLRVTDLDQDLDPFAPDTLIVDVTPVALVAGSTELERLELTETSDSTGIFVGYLNTSTDAVASANDCRLAVPAGTQVRVDYVDPVQPSDTSSALALLDPGFTLFSSINGAPVDGVSVTLIDVSTGLPATGSIFGGDGVTPFPATVVSGAGASDANGGSYSFASGSFLFPLIAPGEYRLEIVGTESYAFPSAVSDAELNTLLTGPYVLEVGSRGASFVVTGFDAVGFDLPLDPTSGALVVTKVASTESAAVGDFVQYLITVDNAATAGPTGALTLRDELPYGFRYQAGSLRLNGEPITQESDVLNVATDGAQLQIALAALEPSELHELRYVTEVSPATPLGNARNTASLLGTGLGDVNTAVADVQIHDDLQQSKAIIMGRVLDGACVDEDDEPIPTKGLANARIWLEDGTYVITDKEGKFHFEGVMPGSHVLQLDASSLPQQYELLSCEEDSRRTGTAYASFVDVQAGTIWRENFYVAKRTPDALQLQSRLRARADAGYITYRYELVGNAKGITDAKTTFMLDAGVRYVPGSAKLNGQAIADPSGAAIGALTFLLPDSDVLLKLQAKGEQAAELAYQVRFDVGVIDTTGALEVKALTALKVLGEKQRTPLLTSRLRVDWPDSLVDVTIAKLGVAKGPKPRTSIAPAANSARRNNIDKRASRSANKASDKAADATVEQTLGARSGAFEPGSDGIHTDTGYAYMEVSGEQPQAAAPAYVLPEIVGQPVPEFDLAWLRQQPAKFAIAWPPTEHNPRMPSIAVAVVHPQGQRPALVVDGALVNPISYEGTVVDAERSIAVSRWRNVSISEATSTLTASLPSDVSAVSGAKAIADNSTPLSVPALSREVNFGSAPVRAEFLPELSYLVADGITPPMVAVRLFDRSGRPARPGLTGEYALEGNFAALNEARLLGLLENAGQAGVQRYRVRNNGIAYIQLEPTSETGELTLRFEFDEHRRDSLRARIVPGQRDWILVGLAEGTFSSNRSDTDDVLLPNTDLADNALTDGRIAFYAKGMVKGEWLLTAAYDTDKEVQGQIRQQIDPNRFYTLYGDGTEQRYDAQSQKKLYLKLERRQFAGLFGDFDTGFDRTEYTRYARTVTGLQVGHHGRRWQLQGFAAETSQRLVRDELRGDGTSGIYRLSTGSLLINSERIAIVVRNRFRPQEVESSTTLVRYRDYSIDYQRGTLLFKQPVFSQDQQFNPIYIEAQYEVEEASGNEELVAGARVAYRLDDQDSEVAITYVTDENRNAGGELMGIDARWEFRPGTRVEAELASTDSKHGTDGSDTSGEAYRLELLHQGERVAGRAYLRHQESNFGLGQQAAIGVGARTYGVEGEYQVNAKLSVRAEAFAQEDLDQDTARQVIGVEAQYAAGPTRYALGLRAVEEEAVTPATSGSNSGSNQRDATQVTAGVSRRLLENRLTLRADTEVSFGNAENTDYPSRAVLGAQYDLNNRIALIGEQEFSWSDERDTQDTRVGLKARPWAGADFVSNVARQTSENGERLFATTGLLQQWRLNERWLLDFGMDRVQTLKRTVAAEDASQLSFRPTNPAASGSFDQDFTAAFMGATYRRDSWDLMSRLEFHAGDVSDKWNLLLGANRQLADGKIVSASTAVLNEELTNGDSRDTVDARVGLAWRPVDKDWLFLNRLDLRQETLVSGGFSGGVAAGFDTRTRKWVDNFNANYRPNDRDQLSIKAGLKYVMSNFDSAEYDSFTGLLGLEYRHDFGKRWDVGAQAALLRSFGSKTQQYSAGVSVGLALFDRTWTSLGYNIVGFSDEDFSAAEYTSQGWYLKVRLRLDQDLMRRFLGFVGVAQHPNPDATNTFANSQANNRR